MMNFLESLLVLFAVTAIGGMAFGGLTMVWWGANRRPHWNRGRPKKPD